MSKIKDLTGKRFGRLLVISRAESRNRKSYWNCKCDCNNNVIVSSQTLLNKTATSCGCYQREMLSKAKKIDLIGKRFGKLTVIKDSGKRKRKKVLWECKCDCGRYTEKISCYLMNGDTKSCGKCNLLFNDKPDLIKELDPNKNKNIDINLLNTFSSRKVWWLCPKCNHSYKTSISNRSSNNTGCPRCNESHGEKIINKLLEKNMVNFTREKRFKDCRDKRSLPFDFYLPDYNLCIEYQGKQHYKKEDVWTCSKEEIDIIQVHDQIKRDYCKSKSINLLEIHYGHINNIEEILTKTLRDINYLFI